MERVQANLYKFISYACVPFPKKYFTQEKIRVERAECCGGGDASIERLTEATLRAYRMVDGLWRG